MTQCINGDSNPIAIPATGECRRCYNARWRREHPRYDSNRRAANRDEDNARSKAYYAEHRDELRAKSKAKYQAEHAEEIAARKARRAAGCINDGQPIETRGVCARCYARLRYRERYDEYRAYQKAWVAAHRDQVNRRQRERRAGRRAAGGDS
jgi:hypothetical protein